MKPGRYYSRYYHFLTLDPSRIESFKVIKSWLRGKEKIIDLGCGLGYLTSFWNAVGLDNSPQAIEIAQKRFPKTRFILADISKKLPFRDKSIDAFVCYNILEHLNNRNRKKLFAEIKRTLKKNGFLIAAYTDETFWLNRLLAFLIPNYGIKDPTHLVSWTPEEFKKELSQHFKILKEKQTSQYGKLISITRFLKGEILLLVKP